ncbi:13445_t:CDS:10, partial [Ambispora gerdemannii]
MYLLPNCIDDLKYSDFWKDTEEPSLNKFLNFRLRQSNLEDSEVEHRRYKDELKSIRKYYDEESEIGKKCVVYSYCVVTNYHAGCLLVVGKRDKNSAEVKLFWELQAKKQDIFKEIRLLEERCKLLEKEQTEMENKMCLKQTQHILDATKKTVDQGISLQTSIIEKFRKRVLDEPYAFCEPPKRRTKVTNDIIAESHSESNEKTDITEDSEIIAEYHSESNEEIDTEVINITEDDAEIKSLTEDEVEIRKKLFKILVARQEKDTKVGKDFLTSVSLNGIIDLSDDETHKQIKKSLNKDQISWLEGVLQKKIWKPTPEFTEYINQFTEETCTRTNIPTIVRKSCVTGRFDSFYHEAHDIAQHILTHFSLRLEAPMRVEYKGLNLERTYAIDTIIYILNRLFRMYQDELDVAWIEQVTPDTKKHKFDGLYKVISTRGKGQTIVIIEFSRGRTTPMSKRDGDSLKLCRNAMRTLNVLLGKVPKERARIYLVQSFDGFVEIKYLIRPLPKIYMLQQFGRIKIPVTFSDFEQFSRDIICLMDWQTDVLSTARAINKATTNVMDPSPTKDISPLIKNNSEEKGITPDPLPKIEYSSTQPESSTEPKTSTTFLPQDIIHDDSAKILDFVKMIHKERISSEIRERNREKKLQESHNNSTPPIQFEVSTMSTPKSLDSKTVKKLWEQNQNKNQDKISQSHKKKGTENITHVIADGIQDVLVHSSADNIISVDNDESNIEMQSSISSEINHMTEISTTARRQNCATEILSEASISIEETKSQRKLVKGQVSDSSVSIDSKTLPEVEEGSFTEKVSPEKLSETISDGSTEASVSSNLTHNHVYFRNKTLKQYPNLYREDSDGNDDYYGITDESLCPLCKIDHDDDNGIEGRYEIGSYYIKCEQRGIEIK